MKQARLWMWIAVAMGVSGEALAQKKGGKPKAPPVVAAPATPAAPAAVDLDAPGGAPAAGAEASKPMDLDAPGSAPAPGADASTAAVAPADQAGGGICDINPALCPKPLDLKAAAARQVEADVSAVQQVYVLHKGRVELNPYWSFTANDQFVSHPGPGLALNYYVSNVIAVGVNGNFYQPFNVDSEFNFQNRRATRLGVPLQEYQWNANLNLSYVPFYGKFAGFGKFIFHYDAYLIGGVGMISTRPIPVVDPDNRNFDWQGKLAFNAGIGLRVFFNRWFAMNLELRDYIFNDKLENIKVASTNAGLLDKATWYADSGSLTNNVAAQLGVSIFLPTSWEYRLPK